MCNLMFKLICLFIIYTILDQNLKIDMQKPKLSYLSRFLMRLFITRDSTPPFIQTIQISIELLFYLIIVYGYQIGQAIFPNAFDSSIITIILLVLFVARFISLVSLIKLFYLILLQYVCQSQGISLSGKIQNYIWIGLLLIIDLFTNISYEFQSTNLTSESVNLCKLFHYVLLVFGVLHSTYNAGFLLHALSGGLFLALWTLKRASMCRSKNCKQLYLRGYLWIAFSHLMIMIGSWLSISILLLVVIPLVLSQAFYQLYSQKKGKLNLDQLYSQQKYLKLAFQLMVYINGYQYDAKMQRQIVNFIQQSEIVSLNQAQKREKINKKALQILSRRPNYEQFLISAQIHILNDHQLLKSQLLLQKIRQNLGPLDWIRKICLLRVRQMMKEKYEIKNKQIHFAYYDDYYACDEFRALMLRGSVAFISMLQYSKKAQIVSQRFRALANRFVKIQRKLNYLFNHIQTKCLTISLLFVSYLLQVGRDTSQANKILENLAFNEDFQINLQIDEKIFLEVQIEKEFLRINKIGQNVSLLLGYDKKQIQNENQSIFLPQFYKKAHDKYTRQFMDNDFSRLHLFNKKTIVRNKWGYYEQCNLVVRIDFNQEDSLVLRGYLQIKNTSVYVWSQFLFISENLEIIQCSDNFSDYAPTSSKFYKADEIFPKFQFDSIVKDGNAEYHPLLLLKADDKKVWFYARKSHGEEAYQPQQKVTELLKTIQMRKFEWNFVTNYYLKMIEILKQITSKQYIILLILSVLSIIGMITAEVVFLQSSERQSDNQLDTIDTTTKVLLFYNSSLAIGMRVNYIDLLKNFNYSNTVPQIDIVNLSLILQGANQKLSVYTQNKYSLPSTIPGVTYSKPNYDMIVEFLSNAYMIRQFNDDLFVQTMVLTRARISIQSIFANSLSEYEKNFVKSLSNSSTSYGDEIAVTIIMISLAVLILTVIRIQYKLRLDENKTLNLLCSIKNQEQMILSTRIFISKITKQQLNLIRFQQQVTKTKNKFFQSTIIADSAANGKEASRSEASFRQMSGRDLLGNSLNNSAIMPTSSARQQEQNQQTFLSQMQELKLTPRKRWIIVIIVLIFLVIGGLTISNQIIYNVSGKIDLTNSVTTIFRLFSTGTNFSRSIILFLNLIPLKRNGYANMTVFDNYVNSFAKQQIQVTFPEGQFSQFKSFNDMLSKYQYQYMCTYLSCNPYYQDEVNIIYTTTIRKIINSAMIWQAQLNQTIPSNIGSSFINSDMKKFIDLAFYAQVTIRQGLLSLFLLYFQSFNLYSNNLIFKKEVLMGVTLGITVLSGIFLAILTYYVISEKKFMKDMLNIIKTDSYINEDNPLGDKEPGKSSI